MSENMNFLSGKTVDCPVCQQKGRTIEEKQGEVISWLCVECGYTSNSTFIDIKSMESSPQFIKDTKFWDEKRKLYWILSVINIPTRGILFPEPSGKQTIWTFVPMVDIPIEEQQNFPMPGYENKFYTKRLNAELSKTFTRFYDGLIELKAIVQEEEK